MVQAYMCKSPTELTIEDLGYLSDNLRCDVSGVGKVKDQERWDYFLEMERDLVAADFEFIKEKGLVVLLSPPQREKLMQVMDVSTVEDNVVL